MTPTDGPGVGEPDDGGLADRILDAAGERFAADGVLHVGMAEVAAAAGCSRATLYRYVENRHALRAAFVAREARRLGARVAAEVAPLREPRRRLVAAVLAAVDGVRSTPTLAAWFTGDNAAAATEHARSSEVIEAMATGFLGDVADPTVQERARWVVRVVISLLTMPAGSPREERHLVETYLVPVILAEAPASRRRGPPRPSRRPS